MKSAPCSVLVACESASQSAQYKSYLESQGMAAGTAYTGADVIENVRNHAYAFIVLGLGLPGGDGIWVLDHLDLLEFKGRTVVLANDDDPRLALVRNRGKVLLHPITLTHLQQTIGFLLENPGDTFSPDFTGPGDETGMNVRQRPAPAPDAPPVSFGGFIGTSPVMQALYEQIQSAARSQAAVFITGESGTGKEVCAEAIHLHSTRHLKPFVPINCAAIPRDLLESEIFGHVRGAFTGAVADRAGAAGRADGGTLFLDEIGEMDPNMQTKLLRFLQNGTFQRVGGSQLEHVDVRIICATNRNPEEEVAAGRFREDLFYRLHVLPIRMPPLRDRGHDVLDIAQVLLMRYAAEEGKRFRALAPDAEVALLDCAWPGNIRQLQNVLRHAVVMHDGLTLGADALPPLPRHGLKAQPAPPVTLGMLDGSAEAPQDPVASNDGRITPLYLIERRAIESAIHACHGNISRAAALLQVSPSTIYRKKAQWDGAGAAPSSGTSPAAPENTQDRT